MRDHIKSRHGKSFKAKGNSIKKSLIKILIIILAIPYAFLLVLAFFGLANSKTPPLSYFLDLIILISPIIIIYIGYNFSKNKG